LWGESTDTDSFLLLLIIVLFCLDFGFGFGLPHKDLFLLFEKNGIVTDYLLYGIMYRNS
jgi:hypothetical protein